MIWGLYGAHPPMTFQRVVFLAGVLCPSVGHGGAQWPQFRGPNGAGVDASTGYPVEFSPVKNVAWKIMCP